MSATIAGPDGKSGCRWRGPAPEFLACHDTGSTPAEAIALSKDRKTPGWKFIGRGADISLARANPLAHTVRSGGPGIRIAGRGGQSSF